MLGLYFTQQIAVTNLSYFKVNTTVRRLDYEGNTAGAEGMAYLSDMLAENIYITDLVRKLFTKSLASAMNSPNLGCYYC